MAGLRSIFILWMLSSSAVLVDCNYEGSRDGENTDPAEVDTNDISVVLENGEETVAEEKAIDEKLKKLDSRRPNDTSLEMEVKIQQQQKKTEKEEERKEENKSKRSTEGLHRSRRYITVRESSHWTKAIIPYVIRDVNLTTYLRNEIKKTMKLYEDYTCFRFVEWDNTTKTKYGLDHNNYIRFVKGSGCWSFVGNLRKSSGGQALSCCGGNACVHEIGHAIGFHHEQKSPFAKDILRINPKNIQPAYLSQYTRSSTLYHNFAYDLNSVMHYGFWGFNNGNGPTMTVFNPKLKYLVETGSLAHFYFFKEMTIAYKCKEMKCPGFSLKCENTGYVAYIKDQCRCRCPTGLDPDTGCTTITSSNKLNQTLKWPASRFALLRPANTTCPEDSKEGSLTHQSDGGFTKNDYQAMGDHENLHFCTFDHENRSAVANLWPSGEYCLTKAGGSCPKSGCPFGWTFNAQNRHCYKMSSEKVKGFHKGAEFCKYHKAYIVNIEDKNENEFVRNIITTNAYIGANDIKTEKIFVGEDGKELEYTNWSGNQPDNWNNEDCVMMYTSGTWNDLSCSYNIPVVCEMSLPEFKEGYIEFEDESISHSGTLPDVISGDKTKLQFCCRDDGNQAEPVVMPTASKFILWQTNREGCQRVKDTIAVSNHFGYRMKPGKTATINGKTPLGSFNNNLVFAYFCAYQPVSKDCGKIIQLTDENPSATVASPYFPQSYHSNVECTWLIKSQKDTRMVLSFDTFEVPSLGSSCDDSLEIRFSLPQQPGTKFCGHEFKTSVYSSENYMNLVLYSKSFRHGKKFKGTVTMITDKDRCYYGPDKGESYRGKVNFSRNFKTCLPWKETTHCVHSTNNTNDALNGLDENYCRNPRSGKEPWCYTQSKGCLRDYCDVCGFGKCHNYYADCADRLKKDQNYCQNTTAWNGITGCAKTCGLCNRQTKKKYAELSCKAPPIPENTTLVKPSTSSTQVGKTIEYYYPTNKNNVFAVMCYSDGSWSKPSACPFGWTLDQDRKKCSKVIKDVVNQRYEGVVLCRKYGGYLGVIANAEENAFATALVREAEVKSLIDLTDKLKEKSHVWTNGETSTYRNWNNGEPNNWSNQDCTVLTTNGKWDDITCKTKFYGVLCQIPLPVSYCKDGTTKCEKFRKLANVALKKPTRQSSTYSALDKSENAVDGEVTGKISHTNTETNPWWEVDLQSVYKVKKVLVVNRNSNGGRFNNVNITIGELRDDMKECIFYEGAGKDGEYIELQCSSPINGRYVKLQLMVKGILQMTEVFVFAYTDIPAVTCPTLTLPPKAKPVGDLLPTYTAGMSARYYFDINQENVFSFTCLSTGMWTKAKECPEGWRLNAVTNKCNKVIVQTLNGQYAGYEICRKYSGYVALIRDKAENDFIYQLVNNAGKKAVIGYSDKLKEKVWKGSNGEVSNYTNWEKGEPNNYNNQDCAVMITNGEWWDQSCTNTFEAVVCQITLPVNSCHDGSTNCNKFKKLTNVALKKPTRQSSTYSALDKSENAVDGEVTGKISHTNTETNPWWEVDLQSVYKVKKVLVVNRNSNGGRFNNVKITIGELRDDMKECIFYEGSGKDGEYIELQCSSPIYGRYVKLQLMVKGILQMTEVFVFAYTDIPAVTCPKLTLPPNAKPVGDLLPMYTAGKTARYYFDINQENVFSFTCLSTGMWSKAKECPEGWRLNAVTKKCNKVIVQTLNGQYAGNEICRKYSGYVASIRDKAENDFINELVDNAGENAVIGYSDKLKEKVWKWSNGEVSNYTNWEGSEPNNYNNQDCAVMNTNGEWWDLYCTNTFEAVVCQITLPVNSCQDGSTNCEKIKKLANVALKKPTRQSSTYSALDKSENAVDGEVTGKISHTNTETNPWWEVDLQSVYKVKKVLVVNRNSNGGRFNNVKITIGELRDDMKECIFYEGPGKDGEYIELQCSSPIYGRYVKLQLMVKGILQMTEVFVFAYTDIPAITCPKLTLPPKAKPLGDLLPIYTAGKTARYYFDINQENVFSFTCLSTGMWTKANECPEGWRLNAVTKKCNKVIVQTLNGQYAGYEICRKYSGYVASIRDKAENDFIYQLLNNAGKEAVIGYSDKLKEQTWKWSNGEVSKYTNWEGSEPNNYNNQDCAVMNTNGEWSDRWCTNTFEAVVCQITLPVNSCQDGSTNCEKFKKLKNVAQGKPVKQSSTYSNSNAELAVDGKLTECSHTKNDNSPWWQVDLGSVYKVKRLLIVNRMNSNGSRLRNLKVTIGKTEDDMKDCVFYEGPGRSSEYIELICTTPLSGQFVKLQMTTAGFLQLTEVYVYTPASNAT